MKNPLPTTSKIAVALLVLLLLGPLLSGLDLWLRFMPPYPVLQGFYAASALGYALWFGSAILAIATLLLIRQRHAVAAAVVCAVFAVVHFFGSTIVWSQVTKGHWLALGAFILLVASAVSTRNVAR